MPYIARIHTPGLYYHVFARGNNKDTIFFEDADYQRFLNNLEKYREKLRYKLYAYCLLPNHFHLLLQVNTISLSKIMQSIMTAYTMYVNKKYKRVGHIFQGRYQCVIVEKDSYFLHVHRYIHLNPVQSGHASLPENYPRSSYVRYIHKPEEEKKEIPQLEFSGVFDLLSSDKTKQLRLFKEFTSAGLKDAFDPVKESTRGILGTGKFHRRLTKVLRGSRP